MESIDNPNIIAISFNPKEYFEKYRDKRNYKKHKGLKRDTPSMDFEAYSSRLYPYTNFADNVPRKLNKKDFKFLIKNCKWFQ